MKKIIFKKSFSLIEVVLACTVLILFLMSGVVIFGTNMRNIVIGKHRLQAIYLAKQGLNNLLDIRDSAYFNTTNHSYTLSNSFENITLDDINYSKTVAVSTPPSGGKITVTVSWDDFGSNRSVTLDSYIANWQSFP
jgi:hypothetical protein